MTQVYLQSQKHLTWLVFLRPIPENYLLVIFGKNKIIKLIKPLYGLCDSDYYWNATVDRHLTNGLGAERFTFEDSMLCYEAVN